MRVVPAIFVLVTGCIDGSQADGSAGGGKGDVWGTDDRIERYEIETDALREAAKSSGATFQLSDLEYDMARDVWSAKMPKTLAADQHLCAGQRFETQPAVSWCSATLIADDIMVSAGHCFDGVPCEDFAVVFDYAYEAAPIDPMLAAKDIPAANVYKCVEMLSTQYDVNYDTHRGNDYAVFRLDRKVTGRAPAPVNWADPVMTGSRAYAIGHPSRIPQKLSSGSVLDGTTNPDFIVHDADVFGGNSGCGVFDDHGTLIGIHVHSSAQRYVPSPNGSCYVVAVCGENAQCPNKPHAYDPRKLKTQLSPELQMRLGIPLTPPPPPQ